MISLKQNTSLADEEASSDEDDKAINVQIFYNLLDAVLQYNVKRIDAIFHKVNNINNLVTRKDQNQNGNTILYLALQNIKKGTNHQKVVEVIKCLIANGALVNIQNDNKKTPVDMLQKRSKMVTNFDWDAIKEIFQIAGKDINGIDENLVKQSSQHQGNCHSSSSSVSESKMPEHYKTTQGAKRTLHGYTYQLKIIMLFVQRIPEGQQFFMATEMDEAHKFDDVVLKYQEEGVWKYRFVQVKHKHEEEYEIKIHDLLCVAGKQKSEGPYFINNYYESFCKIKEENIFIDNMNEEFLLCTNVDFSKVAESYFDRIVDLDDLILSSPKTVKYKLKSEKIEELRILLQINRTNQDYFVEFINKFRFLVKFGNDDIYKLINKTLEEYLKIKNIDFATTYVQDKLLKWFESYKNNQSKYLKMEDKNKFLKSLDTIVRSLFAAGYSNCYIEELRSHGIVFKNPLPELKRALSDSVGIFVLVTLSSKISAIKVCQIVIDELKLLQDQVIFLSSKKIRIYRKLLDTFYDDPVCQLLVIECDGGGKICNTILDEIIKVARSKTIIIIGQQDDVKNLSGEFFHDIGCSIKTMDKVSQDQLLTRQVTFQGIKVSLDQLINTCSAEEMIDDLTLEELLVDEIKMGDDLNISRNCCDKYFTSRTLLKKDILTRIFQDEEVLKNFCFFIAGANKRTLEQFHVNHQWISEWKGNTHYLNGIILLPDRLLSDCEFLKLYQHKKNVYWIEYENEKFLFKEEIGSSFSSLEEGDLCKEEFLKIKTIIIADEPGIGKTTFIKRAAYILKTSMPNKWILYINLALCTNKQQRSLKDITFKETDLHAAIEFLADICICPNYGSPGKNISKQILMESLLADNKSSGKYPRIIIFFDSFDKICPYFKEQTLILLKALQRSNVMQIWITTRTCEEASLEIALGIFAWHLKPIDDDKKQTFVIKLWEHKLRKEEQNVSAENLRSWVKRLFDHYKLVDFTDNPLHLKMLAEVIFNEIIFLQKFEKWNDMTLQFLYEKFVYIKFEIYWNDNQPADVSVSDRERIVFLHHTILFETTDKDAKLAKRAGLVVIRNNNLQLVHQSFAEYLACGYLLKNLESKDISDLIFKILTDNTLLQIRRFLNDNQLLLQKLNCSEPKAKRSKGNDIALDMS